MEGLVEVEDSRSLSRCFSQESLRSAVQDLLRVGNYHSDVGPLGSRHEETDDVSERNKDDGDGVDGGPNSEDSSARGGPDSSAEENFHANRDGDGIEKQKSSASVGPAVCAGVVPSGHSSPEFGKTGDGRDEDEGLVDEEGGVIPRPMVSSDCASTDLEGGGGGGREGGALCDQQERLSVDVAGRIEGQSQGTRQIHRPASGPSFAVVRVRSFCCRRRVVFLDSDLQITSHLYAFFVLSLAFTFSAAFAAAVASAGGSPFFYLLFSPFLSYGIYALLTLFRHSSQKGVSRRFRREILATVGGFVLSAVFLSVFVSHEKQALHLFFFGTIAVPIVWGLLIPLFQLPCLFLIPLSVTDRFVSLFAYLALLASAGAVVIGATRGSGFDLNKDVESGHTRTPIFGLLFVLTGFLVFPTANFVRRSIPRQFTEGQVEEMRAEGSGFFWSRVEIDLLREKEGLEGGSREKEGISGDQTAADGQENGQMRNLSQSGGNRGRVLLQVQRISWRGEAGIDKRGWGGKVKMIR
uniref:Uncharacterized protein n=1 Tax=Chromera velia CCMP2878 TaxID=1169474 RepID=A0A0G4IB40_9ALVE|eukprot:Cvel_12642.t1-p1 / transcript=Cvel_12642.t1 / gene=Cvel_12642 / organism=Chromera_velia_CCMP2878 / gene_product=hypothetical protein / transcript_product=hypothetical protein / location=Cvel_scaffold835:23425-25077(+) / protein_length=522 / sequence_SO=supercontig / SO=protein_coding / is_pseudo=false